MKIVIKIVVLSLFILTNIYLGADPNGSGTGQTDVYTGQNPQCMQADPNGQANQTLIPESVLKETENTEEDEDNYKKQKKLKSKKSKKL